jgi:hypothetical protein
VRAREPKSLAQYLGRRFPLDTQVHSLWLPAIQAQPLLDKKNPAVDLNPLQVLPHRVWAILLVNNIPCLYPT